MIYLTIVLQHVIPRRHFNTLVLLIFLFSHTDLNVFNLFDRHSVIQKLQWYSYEEIVTGNNGINNRNEIYKTGGRVKRKWKRVCMVRQAEKSNKIYLGIITPNKNFKTFSYYCFEVRYRQEKKEHCRNKNKKMEVF